MGIKEVDERAHCDWPGNVVRSTSARSNYQQAIVISLGGALTKQATCMYHSRNAVTAHLCAYTDVSGMEDE
jgi:hypothetical protein